MQNINLNFAELNQEYALKNTYLPDQTLNLVVFIYYFVIGVRGRYREGIFDFQV